MAESKGFFPDSWNFFKNHWGEMHAIYHVASGVINGRMSDNAPDSAKAVHRAMGGTFGGKGDPKDEATYKKLILKMDTSLRPYLNGWVGYAYPVLNSEKWIRNTARDRFEEWRVIITKMEHDDPALALQYLEDIATSVRNAFNYEIHQLKKSRKDITEEDKLACAERAFAYVTEKMAVEGTPIPGHNETPYGVQVRKLFKQLTDHVQGNWEDWWEYGKIAISLAPDYARAGVHMARQGVETATDYQWSLVDKREKRRPDWLNAIIRWL